MNDLKVSTAARAAGISESTVFLLENGSAALLTAGDVARIAEELARQSAGQERGEAAFGYAYFSYDRDGKEVVDLVRNRWTTPLGKNFAGNPIQEIPLYAAPTDAQSRIAKLEAQLEAMRAVHDLTCDAVMGLEGQLTERTEQVERMRKHVEIGAKWMREWLDENLCECEGGHHYCGRNQRWAEVRDMEAALAAEKEKK